MPSKQTSWQSRSRWEKAQAKKAERKVIPITVGKLKLHWHKCTCTKKWLCKFPRCTEKVGQDCPTCFEKKRAIEVERNSGEQMHIQFEPEYAQYSDFVNFSNLTIKYYDKVCVQNLKANTHWFSTPYKAPELGKDILTKDTIKKAMEQLAKVSLKPKDGNYFFSLPAAYNVQNNENSGKKTSEKKEPGKDIGKDTEKISLIDTETKAIIKEQGYAMKGKFLYVDKNEAVI